MLPDCSTMQDDIQGPLSLAVPSCCLVATAAHPPFEQLFPYAVDALIGHARLSGCPFG